MRTSNPVLSDNTFNNISARSRTEGVMTLQGTVNKTIIYLGLLCTSAMWSWNRFATHPESAMTFIAIGGLIGLVLALVTCWKKTWAPITGSLYAVAKGLAVGSLSAYYASLYEGIVMQAVLLTVGVLLALLAAYSTRLIRPSENFKLGIVAATGGIALVYLATLVLGMFGIQIPHIHGNGWMGIGFSVVVVIIAALNLVLDFDFIESGVAQGAPKHMEWYAAFGLMITLVWLYIEILRLLAKLAANRDK